MNNNLIILYSIIFFSGYLFGSIPWAFIIGKINKIDIRNYGSGNVGATNVRRTLGKKWGIACFILDFLKGLLPILILKMLLRNEYIPPTNYGTVIIAIASVIGHMWPLFLKFKGGKGISTTAGILLALAPISLIISAAIWALVFYSSRYVSLASIIASALLPVTAILFSVYNIGNNITKPELSMLTFLSILAIIRHRSNIKRLLNGTESRFEKKNKKKEKEV